MLADGRALRLCAQLGKRTDIPLRTHPAAQRQFCRNIVNHASIHAEHLMVASVFPRLMYPCIALVKQVTVMITVKNEQYAAGL